MLELVKDALGISTSDLDFVLTNEIESCKLELASVGVSKDALDTPDELINNAIVLYCKWMRNWRGEGEQFRTYYEMQLARLPLVSKYNCHG